MTVEPLEPRHGPALLAAARAEPDLFRYLVQVPDEAWLDRALAAEDEIPFAIVSGGVPIGSTRYLTIRPEHRGVEIGWSWVASSAHRAYYAIVDDDWPGVKANLERRLAELAA